VPNSNSLTPVVLVDWNHKEKDMPLLPVANVGTVAYWEEAATRSIPASPATFEVVLILAPCSTKLSALPPVPRLATEVPDTVLVSKE